MRYRFDEQLKNLHTGLIEMGAMCEVAIANATKAILEGGRAHAEQAIETEEDINKKQRELEHLCYQMLMQQQPVARDLRQISSALKMVTDMERIGDQAADIAEIARLDNAKVGGDTYTIKDMSQRAIGMVTDSIDAYVKGDIEIAEAVIRADDEVDRLFDEAKVQLAAKLAADQGAAETVIDLLMIAKYLERIADHAVNIAQWVAYAISGTEYRGGTIA